MPPILSSFKYSGRYSHEARFKYYCNCYRRCVRSGRGDSPHAGREGVKIGIFDLNEERGEAVASELGGAFAKVNVTNEEETDAGFEKIRAALGQERILINCAAPATPSKPHRAKETGDISHFPLDAFNLIIQINLVGTFRCIAKSAAGMMTLDPLECGDRGAMVNTASVAAEDGQIGQAAYSASKGGVVGMTLPIARDLSREGIRVNTILPGIFNTPLLAAAPDNVKQALGAKSLSVASRQSGGICQTRHNHVRGELFQWRRCAPGRCHSHGTARSDIQLIRFDQMTAGDLP